MSEKNDSWAIVELMGHVSIAGRVTKPGEYGGLWQIDIPEGETYRTEFFGGQSVYRIRMVSEEIARAYARPSYEVIEYNAPIITREEHQQTVEKVQREYYRLQQENNELRHRLTAVNALPERSSYGTLDSDSYVAPEDPDEDDDE